MISEAADLVHGVVDQVGIAAIMSIIYSEVIRRRPEEALSRDLLLAGVFGACVALTMLDPIQVRPGIQIDGRHILIGLGTFLLGPLGALATIISGSAMRIAAGGSGLLAGLLGMLLSAAAALVWRVYVGNRGASLKLSDATILGFVINISIASLIVLPMDTAIYVFKTGGVVVISSNLVGCVLVGLMLVREHNRLSSEITERKASRTDPLTGLANRRGFEEALSLVARKRRDLDHITLLMIDIDKFKSINDRFGHARGDEALKRVATIIEKNTRAGDLIARFGGDEFVAVLYNSSVEVAQNVGARICDGVQRSFAGQGDLPVSTSIGVVTVEHRSIDAASLLNAADAAMYQAKREGGGRVLVRKLMAG